MPIRHLTEQHRTLAEEILKGTPRTQIAKDIGISRATLYEWMKDPVWQQYFHTLAREVEEARTQRLLPVSMRAAALMEAALDQAIGKVEGGDSDAPGLDTISQVVKRLIELERLDRGLPTQHTRQDGKRPPASRVEANDETSERIRKFLDNMLSTDKPSANTN